MLGAAVYLHIWEAKILQVNFYAR